VIEEYGRRKHVVPTGIKREWYVCMYVKSVRY
jgi:hypothetical protein